MKNLLDSMIGLILRNRISSVEVADALGKTGLVPNAHTVNPGHHVVGKVRYVYGHGRSNWPIYEQLQDVEEGCILFVDTYGFDEAAVFGDIASKHLFLYKRVKAVVVNGYIRDAHRLHKENYPIWCRGLTPIGANNKKVELSTAVEEDARRRRDYLDGGIMVCDDSGCVLIERDQVTEDTLHRLEFIELQEDIWYYCVDTLKWSLFDTICQKKYLENDDELPPALRAKLCEYDV